MRDKRFALRAEIVDRINNALMPHIRVTLDQAGSRTQYYSLLTKWLTNSGIMYKQVSKSIVDGLFPIQLAKILSDNDPNKLIQETGINPNQAKVVMTHLRTRTFLSELEIVELDDSTKIE